MTISEKIKQLELDTLAAQRWANNGKVEEWVHKYFETGMGGETNIPFSESLKKEQRWWNGPLEVELTELSPAVRTDPSSEYVVPQDYWDRRVGELAPEFTTPLGLPPLIIEYRAGDLSIRDGNTRYETMRVLGWPKCWIIIWYNSQADYLEHYHALSE